MCSVEAAERYNLLPDLVFAVALTEGGEPGLMVRNKNGTFDLGLLQFNTSYLKELRPYGVTDQAVQSRTCYPFHLAAWRIRQHLNESGNVSPLTKAAFYHSRTKKHNERYQRLLLANAAKFDAVKGSKYAVLLKQRKQRIAREQELKDFKRQQKAEVRIFKPMLDDESWAEHLLSSRAMVIIPEAQPK